MYAAKWKATVFQKTKHKTLYVSFHLPHVPETVNQALCGYIQL